MYWMAPLSSTQNPFSRWPPGYCVVALAVNAEPAPTSAINLVSRAPRTPPKISLCLGALGTGAAADPALCKLMSGLCNPSQKDYLTFPLGGEVLSCTLELCGLCGSRGGGGSEVGSSIYIRYHNPRTCLCSPLRIVRDVGGRIHLYWHTQSSLGWAILRSSLSFGHL